MSAPGKIFAALNKVKIVFSLVIILRTKIFACAITPLSRKLRSLQAKHSGL
jgi:hypothetical protein